MRFFTTSKHSNGFSRPQFLFLVCLAMVAFELGIRMAESPRQTAKPRSTNVVPSIVDTPLPQEKAMAKVEEAPPIIVPDQTNAVPVQRVVQAPAPLKPSPKTDRAPGVVGKQPEGLKMDFPVAKATTVKRQDNRPPTNALNGASGAGATAFGIRIAVP